MNEEEKKIKEMEELGVSLIDAPRETVAKASPTKLKLQALTFMVIGKIEKNFLNKMLSQAKEAKSLASINLEKINTMSTAEKQDLKDKLDSLDSNITLLEDRIDEFDDYYRRVVGYAKRSLRIPSVNLGILKGKLANKERKKSIVGMVDAYKQMGDVFSTTKESFASMPKPIKRDVEISKSEQEEIRKSVYNALKGTTDKQVENYAKEFDDKKEEQLDELAKRTVASKDKEQELDNFFENISPVKEHAKLETEDLAKVLNDGKAKTLVEEQSEESKVENKSESTEGKPMILSSSESEIFPKIATSENYLHASEKDADIEMDKSNTLSDQNIAKYAGRMIKNQSEVIDDSYGDISEIVPSVEDLKRQLEESVREREQKRLEKEAAIKKYNAEKSAREKEEEELSKSMEELAALKEEIKRKREEQKSIDELKQTVQQALEYQKQIKENKMAALREEEEAKKYQETLENEQKSKSKVTEEREKIQSERQVLQSETTRVNSNLQKEKEELEQAKKQLQSFTSSRETPELQAASYEYVEGKSVNLGQSDLFGTSIRTRR